MENDLAAFGEFIRSFLNEYNLWGSPLFVGGESYGTTRAAGLSGYLTDHDMPINGVMLLSAVIDVNASAGEQRQLMTLPTEIMTAHYHKKLPPDLQKLSVEQIAKQAREFASGEYLEYLFDGARATEAQREKVLTDFVALHGAVEAATSTASICASPLGPFSTELLRDQHLMTSRLDSRFAGYQLDAGATNTSFDFSNANIENCFLTAFEAYVRNDLNYKNDEHLLRGRERAAVVGRIQHGDQPGDGVLQESAHASVRRHGILRFRLPVLSRWSGPSRT